MKTTEPLSQQYATFWNGSGQQTTVKDGSPQQHGAVVSNPAPDASPPLAPTASGSATITR